MASHTSFQLVSVVLLSVTWFPYSNCLPTVANPGPAYDVNHTTLGCPSTLPCHCHMSYETGEPEKVVNCSSRSLHDVPSFLALTGYAFDRLLLNDNNIKGVPKNAFGGLDVRFIDLSNNSIVSVSDNGFMGAEGVEELSIDNCKLMSSPLSLQFLTNLRKLSMRNCNIKQLAKTSFQPLAKLQELDLSFNPVKFSPPFDIFDTLKKLKVLKVEEGDLSSLQLEILSNLSSLEHLVLKNNNITSLPKGLFKAVPRLRELDLEGNAIEFNNFKEFEVLKHLKVLRLGHCRIETVNADLVLHIPHVHTLVLRHCHIHKLSHGAFRNLFHLSKLDISGNPKVKVTDKLFHGLEDRLKFVGIENMNLSTFPTSAFRKLFLLKKIKANRNIIRTLPKGVFHSLKGKHVEVHLEKNEISDVEVGVMDGVRRPLKLYLQHNNISSLSFMEKDPCQYYESVINVEDNPVFCDCDTATTLQKKAFSVQGRCHTGDSLFRDLKLMPRFKQQPNEDMPYLVTVAADHCVGMDRNKTYERYDCACGEWMWFNGTKVCSGVSGLVASQGFIYFVLSIVSFIITKM